MIYIMSNFIEKKREKYESVKEIFDIVNEK